MTVQLPEKSSAVEDETALNRPLVRYASYSVPSIRCITCIGASLLFIQAFLLFPTQANFRPVTSSRSPIFTPILPPSYPLAVRSPYLSAWLPGGGAGTLPHARPQFWTGKELTWAIIARVNGKTFNIFGVPFSDGYQAPSANVISGHFTSTHTIFTLEADEVRFVLDFFSPVSPKNYLRQSLPFSYLTVNVTAPKDCRPPPQVQVYADIDHTWTGANQHDDNTIYSFKSHGNIRAFQISTNGSTVYEEHEDMATWGRVIWAAIESPKLPLTSSVGRLASVRGEFARDGVLCNLHGKWRHANRNGFPALQTVAGFAYDLGTIADETSVKFVIGHQRDSAINYLGAVQTPYYRGYYPDAMQALQFFLDDYGDAMGESQKLDKTIEDAAVTSAGQKYADILALSLRQTFGGMEHTIEAKTLDTSPNGTMAWIKENSSNGNINTVDIIYPAFPVFYLLNPEWIRLLLEPLVRYLDSGRYKNPYAVHDIGRSYPNATGHDDLKEEQMPIESTGNILIMVYAYTKASGNEKWYQTYYTLLQGYADYLVKHGLHPEIQLSTNDAIGHIANQTNLGIKAAVAINAWGHLTSQAKYIEIGRAFATEIHDNLGTKTKGDRRFFTISYESEHWFGPFNLYPDVLLGLKTFSDAALETANATYVRRTEGVPLMGTTDWGKTDWQMFCAGAAPRKDTRDMFINDLHAFISNGVNSVPFSDRYWCKDHTFPKRGLKFLAGQYHAFRARPTLGAHFSVLALDGLDVLGDVSGVLFDNDGKVELK